jgi:hypothetical protein
MCVFLLPVHNTTLKLFHNDQYISTESERRRSV